MREGMLWFDNSPTRSQVEKVERALAYYESKYGHRPTLCFVHPTALEDGRVEIDGVTIRATNSVLPNHYWLGIDTAPQRPGAA